MRAYQLFSKVRSVTRLSEITYTDLTISQPKKARNARNPSTAYYGLQAKLTPGHPRTPA